MKNLRKRFERFCFSHRNWGIPNLMLFIAIGSAIVYLMSMFDRSYTLYNVLCFDRELILQGQIWRLITYVFTYSGGSILMTAVGLMCYFSLGRAMENIWGTFRFNLFYFTGVLLQDIFCLVFDVWDMASPVYLNLSLFLGYATLYPNTQFLLLFIIPVKAWIFAVFDLVIMAYDVIRLTYFGLFPDSLFPLVALLNYFLFFGKDVVNVFPMSWRVNFSRLFKKKPKNSTSRNPIEFQAAGSYAAATAKVKAPYTHRCTVCGRTDVSNPELEFRYCSRCKGYFCYCEEHISNHNHVE